jgi:hypothetical protein
LALARAHSRKVLLTIMKLYTFFGTKNPNDHSDSAFGNSTTTYY